MLHNLIVQLGLSPTETYIRRNHPVLNIDRRLVVERDISAEDRRYRRVNSGGEDLNRDFEIHRDATQPFGNTYSLIDIQHRAHLSLNRNLKLWIGCLHNIWVRLPLYSRFWGIHLLSVGWAISPNR